MHTYSRRIVAQTDRLFFSPREKTVGENVVRLRHLRNVTIMVEQPISFTFELITEPATMEDAIIQAKSRVSHCNSSL